MRIDALLPRASDNCITCPSPPSCSCSATQDCFQINRDCYTCATFKCVAKDNASSGTSGSGGVSKGALAGAVIGALIFLAAAIAAFLWYRRKSRLRSQRGATREVKPDIPAPAETVLNRPDPTEKPPPQELNTVRVYSTSSSTTIDLDPESQHSTSAHGYPSPRTTVTSNPFDDTQSIQTAGTEGTNVIPIALVTPDTQRASSPHSLESANNGPVRPARGPDLNLNLEHVNVSRESMPMPRAGYPLSTVSGVSGVSSRNSYMSGASFASDFLNEAPMIITPIKGNVRQVLGVVKAEVINAPRSSGASSEGGLRSQTLSAKPPARSPLAATSFGPSDISTSSDDSHEAANPFDDRHISTRTTLAPSPSHSVTTFGQPSPGLGMTHLDSPTLPWSSQSQDYSRPSSMSTQAGSVIGIENATRVNLGFSQLTYATASSPGYPRSPFRTTMGRLVTPPSNGSDEGSLEEQQQKALAHAQARAQAQGMDPARRISGSSVMTAASRADSILESFPFVPPSPISDRPMRSPPVSPLGQQTFSGGPSSPLAQQSFTQTSRPAQERSPKFTKENIDLAAESDSELPAPPNRRTLGLSTGSQLSTASSGLGSFPFQIDSGPDENQPPPSAFSGRQRASLDTLAITSDLSSYPLGFDRDSTLPPKKNH